MMVFDAAKPIPQFLKDYDKQQQTKKRRYGIRYKRDKYYRVSDVHNQLFDIERTNAKLRKAQTQHPQSTFTHFIPLVFKPLFIVFDFVKIKDLPEDKVKWNPDTGLKMTNWDFIQMQKNKDSPRKQRSKSIQVKKTLKRGKGNTIFMDPTGIKHKKSTNEKIKELNKNLYQ